ncbi:MAG: hypothetical protein WCF67_17310 [Chitinophagaceae bacterium]
MSVHEPLFVVTYKYFMMLKEKKLRNHQEEMFRKYYQDKINQMKAELEQLNLLDHPLEITSVCRKIVVMKQLLFTMQQPHNKQ